jgi:hypothetical protein
VYTNPTCRGFVVRVLALLTVTLVACPQLYAQQSVGQIGAPVRPAYSDFFELARPGAANVLLYGGGFSSNQYATIDQGAQFEQSITRYLGITGRASGYQLFEGEGFENPLDPASGKHKARLNFGRFLGGIDFTPYPGTHIYLLGGKDVGDSHAYVLESDVSSWLFSYSRHPLNFSLESGYDGQNHVTTNAIDFRMVLFSRGSFFFEGGAGGAIYNGGSLSGGLAGQGGPAISAYLTRLKAGLDLQAGYGSSQQYVQLEIFKVLSWNE